jgi:hypothetical protein
MLEKFDLVFKDPFRQYQNTSNSTQYGFHFKKESFSGGV